MPARTTRDIPTVCFQMQSDGRGGRVFLAAVAWSRYLTEDQEEFLDELLGALELGDDVVDSPPPDARVGITFYVTADTKAALSRLGRDAGLRGAGPLARLLVLGWLNAGDFPRPRRRRIPGNLR